MERTVSRDNNFNVLRFTAALMVMAGHMAFIDGSGNVPILCGQGIQAIGVKIFFLMGGYLIAKSWLADPNVMRYSIKRIFRIFPPLVASVCFAVVAGAFFTTLSVSEYFSNANTLAYLKNILLYPVYSLPGVFTENPYPNAVNGSLWTLPVEVAMYICIPIVFSVARISKQTKKFLYKILLITGAVCLFRLAHLRFFPDWRVVVWGTDIAQAVTLIPYYFWGIVFIDEKMQERLNLQIAVVLLTIYICVSNTLDPMANELLMFLVFPYCIFSFALSTPSYFRNMFNKYEVSYGIYLYGFPVQQMIVCLVQKYGLQVGRGMVFIVSLMVTYMVALISNVLIEKPTLRLSKYLLKKLK